MDPFVIYGPQYSKLQEQMDIAAYSEDSGGLKQAIQVLIQMGEIHMHNITYCVFFLLVGICCRRA